MNQVNPDEVFESRYKGESYIDDYNEFMKNLDAAGGNMAAGEIGEMIVRMGAHYIRHNAINARALKIYHLTAQKIYSSIDGAKPITASKAEVLAAATPEAAAYQEAKMHVQNIETAINALKALQRGVLNEYAYSGT